MPEIVKPTDATKRPKHCVAIFAPTGTGKTYSTLKSFVLMGRKNIVVIQYETRPMDRLLLNLYEDKDIQLYLELDNVKATGDWFDAHMRIIVYKGFDDMKNWLGNPNNVTMEGADCILSDNMSDLSSGKLMTEITKENWDAKDPKKKAEKGKFLTFSVKPSEESYGVLYWNMITIIELINWWVINTEGKVLVYTFLDDVDRFKKKIPLLEGRKTGTNLGSYMNYIGYVNPQYDKEGHTIYPPYIRFEGEDIECRWGGSNNAPKQGNFDLSRILELEG